MEANKKVPHLKTTPTYYQQGITKKVVFFIGLNTS